MDLTPVVLRGRWLTLEPIDARHAPDLFQVMQDDEVCRYLFWSPPRNLDETQTLVREARDLMTRGESIVFAQIWNDTGRCVGSTRLLDVRPADRQVEIGSTFLARSLWRTPANTESKFLFLTPLLREARLRPRCVEDRRPERALPGGNRPTRRLAGRCAPEAHGHQRLPAGHGLLLHPRQRVAGREAPPRPAPPRSRPRILTLRGAGGHDDDYTCGA